MSYIGLATSVPDRTIAGISAVQEMSARIRSADTAWDHVPLSRRTSDEILAKEAELRAMAATATTEEVARALRTLADRYAELAKKRRAEEN